MKTQTETNVNRQDNDTYIGVDVASRQVCEGGQCLQATVLEDYEESTAQGRYHCRRS